MDDSSVKNKLLNGFAWESMTRFLVQLGSWGSTIYVARLLSPNDYGVMAIALVITHVLTFVLEMGMAEGLIQKREISQQQIDGVFYISIIFALMLAFGTYISAPLIAQFYEEAILTDVFETLSIAILISGFIVMPKALVLRELDFRYRALVDMWANFASIVVVVVMVTLGYGVWSLVYAYLTLQLSIAIGYIRKLKFIPKARFWYNGLGDIISFGYKLMLSRLLTMVQTKSDVFIAGAFVKADLLGYYAMALTFATIPATKIGTMFNALAFPTIAKVASDALMVKKYYLELQKYLLMICMPMLVGLALVAEEFVIVLLTDTWSPIVGVLQILCVANVFIVLGMLAPQVLIGLGKAGLVLKYNVFVAILLPLAILCGVMFGLYSMCWFIVVASFISFVVIKKIIVRTLGISKDELYQAYCHIIIASVVMAVSVLLVQYCFAELTPIYLLLLKISGGAIVYVLTYYLFFRGEISKVVSNIKAMKAV